MLLGLTGPHSIGKTTATNTLLQQWAGNRAYRHVTVVQADICLVHYMGKDGAWKDEYQSKELWKGEQSAKLPMLEDIIADDRHLWLIESARYFTGMYEHITNLFKSYGGGVRFEIVVTYGEIMGRMIRQRCQDNGKTFREDYWDDARLQYESFDRYNNNAHKWLYPNGVPTTITCVDAQFSTWPTVIHMLDWAVKKPAKEWYK